MSLEPFLNPTTGAGHVRGLPDDRLGDAQLAEHLQRLAHWTADSGVLERRLSFPDFHHTMAFVNAVAWIAHQADHHPDLEVGYNHCVVRWSTHSAQGLTLKDIACAALVDALQWPKA